MDLGQAMLSPGTLSGIVAVADLGASKDVTTNCAIIKNGKIAKQINKYKTCNIANIGSWARQTNCKHVLRITRITRIAKIAKNAKNAKIAKIAKK